MDEAVQRELTAYDKSVQAEIAARHLAAPEIPHDKLLAAIKQERRAEYLGILAKINGPVYPIPFPANDQTTHAASQGNVASVQ